MRRALFAGPAGPARPDRSPSFAAAGRPGPGLAECRAACPRCARVSVHPLVLPSRARLGVAVLSEVCSTTFMSSLGHCGD